MVQNENKKLYDMKYHKENSVIKNIRFGKNTEKDILDYLSNLNEPFGTYVKRLIKEDMEKEKSEWIRLFSLSFAI